MEGIEENENTLWMKWNSAQLRMKTDGYEWTHLHEGLD